MEPATDPYLWIAIAGIAIACGHAASDCYVVAQRVRHRISGAIARHRHLKGTDR